MKHAPETAIHRREPVLPNSQKNNTAVRNIISGMTGVAHLVYMSISCATPSVAAAKSPTPQENCRPIK